MISNFERKVRQFKLWQYIDRSLSTEKVVPQATIIKFAEENNLGSKSTILNMLSEFVENKMLKEKIIANEVRIKPGRPKKGYTRPNEGTTENILVNLAVLPKPLQNFIHKESVRLKIGKNEVIIQLLTWGFLQFVREQGSELIYLQKRPIGDQKLFSFEKNFIRPN